MHQFWHVRSLVPRSLARLLGIAKTVFMPAAMPREPQHMPGIVPVPDASCATRRVYHPSLWERWWRSNIASLSVDWGRRGCPALCSGQCVPATALQQNGTLPLTIWLQFAHEWQTEGVTHAGAQTAEVVSHHRFLDCTGATLARIPIEPLAGPLRHPYHNCVKKGSMSASTAHLLPMWHRYALPTPRRHLFFDCGASLYNSGSGGTSQSWMIQGYARRGLPIHRTLAWEFTEHSNESILKPLPADLRAATTIYRSPDQAPLGCCQADRLSYFNFGVDAEHDSLRNPLVHLRVLASVDDFVAFKLDIDSPSIEIALVEQILSDPSIAELIDDFYWEHVVMHSTMENFGWGHDLRRMPPATRLSMNDSYDYFTRLREMGIRAHSWI